MNNALSSKELPMEGQESKDLLCGTHSIYINRHISMQRSKSQSSQDLETGFHKTFT